MSFQLSHRTLEKLRNKTLSRSAKTEINRTPRVLLIDDDVIFGMIMCKLATQDKIELWHIADMEGLENIEPYFDVVIIDHHLEQNLFGADVAQAFKEKPVLLISSSKTVISEFPRWAKSIRRFLNKDDGAYRILTEAIEVYLRNQGDRAAS